MSTNEQGMLDWRLSGLGLGTTGTGKGQKGSSYPSRLKSGFPDSPITHNDIDRASQTGIMQTLLGHTDISDNPDFGTVNLSYDNGAPAIRFDGDVKIAAWPGYGNQGWPATPFVPNIGSPGEVSNTTNLDPKQITANLPSPAAILTNSYPPGSGEGSALSPSVSSQKIGEQDFTDLDMGSSS